MVYVSMHDACMYDTAIHDACKYDAHTYQDHHHSVYHHHSQMYDVPSLLPSLRHAFILHFLLSPKTAL